MNQPKVRTLRDKRIDISFRMRSCRLRIIELNMLLKTDSDISMKRMRRQKLDEYIALHRKWRMLFKLGGSYTKYAFI